MLPGSRLPMEMEAKRLPVHLGLTLAANYRHRRQPLDGVASQDVKDVPATVTFLFHAGAVNYDFFLRAGGEAV